MNSVQLAKFIQFGLKAAIFISLLTVCYFLFMKEALEKSAKGEKRVKEKSVNLGFESPAVVICSSPPFKASISEQYDFEYPTRDLFNMRSPFSDKNKHLFADKTVRKLFEDFSYGNDLEFRVFGMLLKEGDNKFGKDFLNIEMKKIITPYDGVCHVLQARSLESQNWSERNGLVTIAYKKSMNKADIPKSFTLYLTERDQWQGDNLKFSSNASSKLLNSNFCKHQYISQK